ncbi:MAG: hypothetical protein GY716_13570 [bacterium]|nr:hypothetical protein [bacterium]
MRRSLLIFWLFVLGGTVVVAETILPPEEPTGLLATKSGDDIVLSWSPVSVDLVGLPKTVASYRVYAGSTPAYAPDKAGGTNRIGQPAVPTLTHTNAFIDGQTYYYLVSAVDTNGVEGNTQEANINAPGIETVAQAAGDAVLTWRGADPPEEVSGYRVYWTSVSLDYQNLVTLGDVATASVTLPDLNQDYFLTLFGADLENNLTPFTQEVEVDVQSAGGTPPSISATIDPPAGPTGWYNSPITVTFDCTPLVPGVVCPPPLMVDTDGASQPISGTADDGLGNVATVSFLANVDQTDVVFTPVLTPGPNGFNWNNSDVTLSFICTDGTSGVTLCPEPRTIRDEGANQLFYSGTDDVAHNASDAFSLVSIDKTLPGVMTTLIPPANAAGWHAGDVDVSWVCTDTLSGVAVCPAAAQVTAEGAGQIVGGDVDDFAGNVVDARVTINLDKTPPVVLGTTPPNDGRVAGSNVTLMGTVDDLSGLATVMCDGVPGTAAGPSFSCDLTLAPGDNPVDVDLVDLAGNPVSHQVTLRQTNVFLPTITIDSPAPELVTQGDDVAVSGTYTDAVSVTVNGIAASLNAGMYDATVPITEGTTTIVATAENSDDETASATVIVRRDTDPPVVVIETPQDGDALAAAQVAVAGTVNDIIPGATVNADDVTVTVNGQPAQVNNRTFFLPTLSLVEGMNNIQVVALDSAGNLGTTEIDVERLASAFGIRVIIVSGDAQSQPVYETLASPLRVRVESSAGVPMPNRLVTFEVSRGDGLLSDPGDERQRVSLLTDGSGEAEADLTLGSRTGMGFHRVRVTTPGALASVEFCATGTVTAPAAISAVLPLPAQGSVGDPLPRPLRVIVTDSGGNTIVNVPVDFTVASGGGLVGGQSTVQVLTNPDGMAETTFALGTEIGLANHVVEATYAGNSGLPATFAVSGVALGEVVDTTVSGTVQDSATKPIVGARAIIVGTALEAFTGADGSFTIAGVEPGGLIVKIEGSAANDAPNSIFFPDIAFAIDALPGVANTLDQPVVLPFLDMAGAKMVGGPTDEILEMQDVPGFAVKVFANSVILHDGNPGQILMTSSQVKFDKVPMAPPQGSTPMIVGTLQPGGIRFDPPAQVIYPNAEGFAPGDVADIFAFHHDIGEFVNLGPGTVSADGSVVASDPGFGIVESGWHCLLRMPGAAGDCEDCRLMASGPDKVCLGASPDYSAGPGSNINWSASGGGPTNPNGSGSSFSPGPFTQEGNSLITATRTCEDGTFLVDFVATDIIASGPMTTDTTVQDFFIPEIDLVLAKAPKFEANWNRICDEQEKCCPLTGELGCTLDCNGGVEGMGSATGVPVPILGNAATLINRVICKKIFKRYAWVKKVITCELELKIGYDSWEITSGSLSYFRNDCTNEEMWTGTAQIDAQNVNLSAVGSVSVLGFGVAVNLGGGANLDAQIFVADNRGLVLAMPSGIFLQGVIDLPFFDPFTLPVPIPNILQGQTIPHPFTLPTPTLDCASP